MTAFIITFVVLLIVSMIVVKQDRKAKREQLNKLFKNKGNGKYIKTRF